MHASAWLGSHASPFAIYQHIMVMLASVWGGENVHWVGVWGGEHVTLGGCPHAVVIMLLCMQVHR